METAQLKRFSSIERKEREKLFLGQSMTVVAAAAAAADLAHLGMRAVGEGYEVGFDLWEGTEHIRRY